jgi:uncharacterized membrane protein YkvA (DUF1232 family)
MARELTGEARKARSLRIPPLLTTSSSWHSHDRISGRTRDDERAFRDQFWRKVRHVVASIPFVEDLLTAHYCAFDKATPLPVKASLFGALAYFLLPMDAVPDVLPVLGFTDDAAMLAAALKLMASHIRPEHRAAAKAKLAEFSKA